MNQHFLIKSLYRYPILPMLGQEIQSLVLTQSGIVGNQLYRYEQDSEEKNSKKEQFNELKLFQPYEVRVRSNGTWLIKIESPDGDRYTLDDDQLLAYLVGKYQRMFILKDLFVTKSQENTIRLINEEELNMFNNRVERLLFLAEHQIHIVISGKQEKDSFTKANTLKIDNVRLECLEENIVTKNKKNTTIIVTQPLQGGYLQTNARITL